MSESNIFPNSGSPESVPQHPVDDSLVNDVWQDWETVELPNTLNVDAIAPSASESAAELDQVAHLIGLIQQLNECNTQLLDRVEQLEGAIEHSQTNLQTEIAQHQQVLAEAGARETALQTQLSQLMHELELSHQANQRQQILVETLSEQLENSQERIAQLERECSIAQSRCGEQAQKIVEVENSCRDLQIRLQRQQRYTMQFKVALNKCLDVPSPCEEDRSIDPVPSPHALLPKVVSIQPWSAQPQFPEIDLEESLPPLKRLRTESIEPAAAPELNSTLSEWIDSPDVVATPDQTLVAEVVEAIEAIEPASPKLIETIEITSDMLRQQSNPPAEPAPVDEEAALWQDLARLIEVSAEDVVRASTAADFTEFAQQINAEPDWQPPATESPTTEPPAPPQAPVPSAEPPAPHLPAIELEEPIVKSNWPSPVVYPLRQPTRKRKSLAAVELPSFPR